MATSTTTPTKTTKTTIPAKPIVRWLGKNRYSVSSRTTPGRIHEIDTYRLTCTCPAGQWSKRCWALGLVLSYEHWRKNEMAKAAATATHFLRRRAPMWRREMGLTPSTKRYWLTRSVPPCS